MDLTSSVSVVRPARHPVRQLAAWAAEDCRPGDVVLNVGAGASVSGAMRPLLGRSPYLVGVDPDAAIERNTALDERHRMGVEELAALCPGRFDLLVSVYVLEHVEDPEPFARACATLLRPGGSWFALTLNVRHYFGAATWALSRMHVADHVLHRLKGEDLVHEHHFPTRYRFNSQAVVTRACEAAGFKRVDFRCYDAVDPFAWYLPRPLRWFPVVWSRTAYRVGAPQLMGQLTFRATMPPARDA